MGKSLKIDKIFFIIGYLLLLYLIEHQRKQVNGHKSKYFPLEKGPSLTV